MNNSDQPDLFEWADSRPSTVIDKVRMFKDQRLKTALWRKRVQLGVYDPPAFESEILELEQA